MEIDSKKESSVYSRLHYILRKMPDGSPSLEEIKSQMEKDAILDEHEQLISNNIISNYKLSMEQLDKFLTFHYMLFSYKMNKCKVENCYNDIYKRKDKIIPCLDLCNAGIKSGDKFVQENVDKLKTDFLNCLDESQVFIQL